MSSPQMVDGDCSESTGTGRPHGGLGNAFLAEKLKGAGRQAQFDVATEGAPSALPFKSELERAFSASFSSVVAYTGQSEAMAAMNAAGAARGEEVVFADRAPAKEVVAHELAHVVQQRGGGTNPGGMSDPEADAHAAADAVMAGLPVAIGARASSRQVYTWNSHEHMAFGNLAVIKATGGSFNLDPSRDTSIDDRDGMLAEINEQGAAAMRVETNDSWVATSPYSPPVRLPNSISFGDASELSGDYERNPAGLATRTTGDTGYGPVDFLRMATIAQRNVNHFYPLCGQEYQNHHQRAVSAAAAGDQKTAILEEGFASHFLQDCYAAGHMAPRALDRIGENGQGESELGLNRSKKWHDALNELTTGLPTTRGRFRGDDTMNSADLQTISSDTAKSLKEVLDTLAGRPASAANISIPTPNHSAIMSDPDYGPLWGRMMGDYEEDLREAETRSPGMDESTDGGTNYSTRNTADLMRANVYGSTQTQLKRVTNSEWNGAVLVFNLTVDGRAAPAGTEVWVQWFNRDTSYDHHESGNVSGEFTSRNATVVQDTDSLISGPHRVALAANGVGSARGGSDNTNDTYGVFYADRECTVPVGRSNVQGSNRGRASKPLSVSAFSWSSNRLSFSVAQSGQPVNGQTVYLKWFDRDSQYDRDSRGNLGQTIADTDEQQGGSHALSVTDGRASATATGSANNSGDTYATVYLDDNCTIPLGRSTVQP